MKKRIYINKFYRYGVTLAAVFICSQLFLCGCEARNSGLYQVTAGNTEQSEENSIKSQAEENGADSKTDAAGEPVTGGESGNGEETDTLEGTTATAGDGGGERVEVSGPQVIYVHVCGAVNDPGVYELEADDRIFNAVEAAGGFAEDACEDYVNLAEKVSDGMKINIPTLDRAEELGMETEPGVSGKEADQDLSGEGPSATSSAAGSSQNTLVNINTADADTLCTLTGIGATKAAAIIAYRETSGRFSSIEDIKNVSGIGDSTYSKLKDEITTGNE